MAVKLNPGQAEARRLLASPATHVLIRGGSRSGKTFLLIRAIVIRAMREPETRHGIFRHRFNAIKHSIIFDTFPKVMRLCFPGAPYSLNKTDWFVRFPNGSEILFHGLDSSDRTEKILGLEFATVYLNEASQISYNARNMLLTRLAQKSGLAVKEYIDANPPTTSHWLYSLFERKVEPKGGEPLADPDDYATMQINPDANRENLSPEYLAQLESLPEKERQRFLFGNYQTAIDGALWTLDLIRRAAPITDANRDEVLATLRRVVVAVDPSGCSGADDFKSDEVGISVVGLDMEGNGHVLDDLTCRKGPAGWAAESLRALDLWKADRIIAEKNFGGAMVENTIRSVRSTAPVKLVTASRGKVARAEPISALYEQGKVFHHGRFPDLEDQLCQFSASGYQGAKSPDRADACIAMGSLVSTANGPVPIENVTPGMMVHTRFGLRRVLAQRCTDPDAETMILHTTKGNLEATCDHVILADGEWIPLYGLLPGMELSSWNGPHSTARITQDTRQQSTDPRGFILRAIKTIGALKGSLNFMLRYGSIIRNPNACRRDTSSTTKTKTHLTMIRVIWSAFLAKSTPKSIGRKKRLPEVGRNASKFSISLKNGTLLPKGLSGTGKMAEGLGVMPNPVNSPAKDAGMILHRRVRGLLSGFVPLHVVARFLIKKKGMKSWFRAQSARSHSSKVSTGLSLSHAQERVVGLSGSGRRVAVYDLMIEDDHEFYANGILVHNCIWGLSELMLEQQAAPAQWVRSPINFGR